MKKFTNLIIVTLLIAVISLSIAVGYLFGKTSSVSADSSEVPGSLNSSESETGATEPENEITELRCSVQLGTLTITEGDDFHVSELNGSDYEAYTEDGAYIVNGSTTHDNHIVVTVPKDYPFETVELSVAGGALAAENIHTRNLYTNCDKGAIDCSGSVSAVAEVRQLQGKTVLNIDGRQTDYNYSLDLDLGHIGVGEEQYAGPRQHQNIDNGAEKTSMPAALWAASVYSFQKLINHYKMTLSSTPAAPIRRRFSEPPSSPSAPGPPPGRTEGFRRRSAASPPH